MMWLIKIKIFFPPLGGGASVGGATGQMVVTATHPFTGQQPGDLSFAPGDSITVITKTDSQYDWWEGQLDDGRVGIFPANFVTYWLLPPIGLMEVLQVNNSSYGKQEGTSQQMF